MAYELNKTDGTILTNLIDGQIDTESTNLTLVGRNYTGYGEAFNENFIKLLENFANTAAPSNPLAGQTWWNTEAQRLQVYDGAQWKASGGPFVQNTRPQMVAGDLWIDNENQQVYAYDGNIENNLLLLGPDYTRNQGKTGFETASILDQQSRSRTVAKFFIGSELVGVFSALEFTPIFSQRITELVTTDNPSGTIFEGLNIVDRANFKWYGTAESANALVTAGGEVVTAAQFLPSDNDGVTTGTLTIQNSGGLTIGLSQNNVQKVVGPRFFIENQIRDHDLSLRVRSSAFQSLIVDGIYIDASEARVGIFTTDRLPEYTLDVEGDLRVTGNLLVEGDTTSVDVATLTVEDKNIELARISTGNAGDDSFIEDGGVILKSSQGDKELLYKGATNSWTANVGMDLSDTGDSYRIGGIEKLTNTSLVNVTQAVDLVEIGTLQYLNVDYIEVDNNYIKSGSLLSLGDPEDNALKLNLIGTAGIDLNSYGSITVNNQIITGVATTDAATGDDTDVANKEYVDTQISVEPIAFSMDITGLGTGSTLNSAVGAYLTDLYPPLAINTGKIARIHTTSYTGATVEGVDIETAKNISYIEVDSNGTQNESVVQDVTFNDATGNVVLEPARTMMTYRSNGSSWVYQSTTPY